MRAPFVPVFLLLLAAAGPATAQPLMRDLGQGLVYARVRVVPGGLPGREAVHGRPCVLDIRFARGNADAAGLLLAWLKFHAGARTPVFLLANAATSPALLLPLDAPDAVAGLVIIGPAATDFTPDIAVAVSAAADRRAYQALDDGATLDSLLIEKVDKPRLDEEKLNRDHLADTDAADDDDEPDQATPAVPPAKTPPQTIDRVLQRAVQLDRTLLALRKL